MSSECDNLLLVQAEFDGELDTAEALRAARHRQDCVECCDAYAQLAATRALLVESAPRHRAPEHLRRAIAVGLGASAKPVERERKPRGWWREGASFALGAALAASVALLIALPAQPNIVDEIVASHIRALQPGHLEDVVSTDEHTVKPWFDGRIDFAPPVKDLAAKNFPLLGGRLDYVDGHPVAVLVYGSAKHVIDLYVWPAKGNAVAATAARDGYNTVHWSENGMEFWAVSDLEARTLTQFTLDWRAAN